MVDVMVVRKVVRLAGAMAVLMAVATVVNWVEMMVAVMAVEKVALMADL